MKIKNTEIIDNTVKDLETGNVQVSEISVLVEIEYQGKGYFLDYQTTTTHDYGAYSSDLKAYEGTDDYESLQGKFDDDESFFSFLEKVKEESGVQGEWKGYVDENYDVNEDHFGGMDANSEVNEAAKNNSVSAV